MKLAALAAAVLLAACGGSPPAEPVAPLLVIGVDGLEWSVLKPLLAQGRCPNLRALMEQGTFGRLGTFTPTLSPIIWNSIATGKLPKDHGIHQFIDNQGREYTSSRRACKAIWNVAGDHGLKTNVFGWWTTWPVEAIDGVMVSGSSSGALVDVNWKPALMPDQPDQVHPAELTGRVMDLAKSAGSLAEIERIEREKIYGELPMDELGRVEKEILIPETRWSVQSDATFAAVSEALIGSNPADLHMVYFGGPDVSGHRFWRYHEPEAFTWYSNPAAQEKLDKFYPGLKLRDVLASEAGEAALADVIPNYVEWIDEIVGRLVAAAGDGATVMIVSDHGMHATATEVPTAQFITGHHNDAAPGVIVAAGPGIARRGDVTAFLEQGKLGVEGSVLSVMPTVLALLGIPPARDLAGRAHTAMLEGKALENASLPPVDTFDEGFRAPSVIEMPDDMGAAFTERFADLGYLEMQGSDESEPRMVDPEGFVPDTKGDG